MRKLIPFLLVIILFASCADPKTIDGKRYRPYGLMNEDLYKNPSIQYEVSGWALFSGILWSETIIVPIYVFGYNFWQPVGKKADYINTNPDKGVTN